MARGTRQIIAAAFFAVTVFGPAPLTAETSIFPLPEIVVSPTEGLTFGVLGIALFADESKEIRRILAPDIRYNEIFGVYPTVRYFGFPSPTQRFFLSVGKSTKIDEYYRATYAGNRLLDGWLDLEVDFFREQDSRERFFGIGNDTDEDEETNYTGDLILASVVASVRLPDDLLVAVGSRVRHMRIRRGGVKDVDYTGDVFPDAPGLDGATIFGQSFGLRYDTRDLVDAPTIGSFASAEIELIDTTTSYVRYSIEGRTYRPLRQDRRVILAARSFLQYLDGGSEIPFYELSSMGGVENLRGFGTNRFRDKHRLGLQLEVRNSVYRRQLFGVLGVLEVAPFVDVGKVFASSRESPITNLHWVGGLGFRAVVRPQVVAFVDFGYGGEGLAAFTGIDYPF